MFGCVLSMPLDKNQTWYKCDQLDSGCSRFLKKMAVKMGNIWR